MLSRISLLTHKSASKKYQQLLKLANPAQTVLFKALLIFLERNADSGGQKKLLRHAKR
jgi:hypothetical protein